MIQTVKLYLLLTLVFLMEYHQSAAQMNPDTIINRYHSWLIYTAKVSDETPGWVNSLDENGQWSDINYQDSSRGGWGPSSHIKRVKDMALAWSDERNKGYQTELYWQAILRSLNHWLTMRYQCTNWWYNEIGVPIYFRDIITLTRRQLTAPQLKQSLEVFNQVKIKGVGANLTWTADLGLHYGAFTNDIKKMDSCSKLIAGEIKISKGDGIQPDYSFHQHGPRLQSFHYGRSFLFDNARLAWELRGTTWALPQEKIDLLLGLLLNGDQWMTRGSSTVPGTVDRAVSRPKQLDVSDISDILPYLMEVSPGSIPALTDLDKRLKGTGQPLTGFRYYPYSDFAAFQQPSFAFFLKTQSNRTKNTESINSENLKGRFLNNGTTWFMKTGKEYMDMMPVWNWERLPGLANVTGCVKQEGLAFTGSVSDSVSGLTATDNAMLTESSQVNTHQIWAAHHKTVVILTVFIPEKNKPVPSSAFLSMDQSRLNGEVVAGDYGHVSKEGVNHLKNTTWLYHAGFAYIPIQPSTVNLYMDTVTGSWASINTSIKADTVSDNIFMPVIEMPITANGISTGYGVVSCASAAEARSLAQKPAWRVLRNDKDHQAVLFSDGLLMSAFFTAGTLKISEKESITASHPCLLMKDAGGQVTVSDPSRNYDSVSITIGGKRKNILLNKEGYSVSEQW